MKYNMMPTSVRDFSDCTHLDKIHSNLYLCSKAGNIVNYGENTANIVVASPATVQFLKKHPSPYRAFVTCDDTHQISYPVFVKIFEKASDLLHKALDTYNMETFLSCHAGINRSVTTILMYVIRNKQSGLTWTEARDYIRDKNRLERRVPALTNTTFEQYLAKYNKQVTSKP